MKHFSIALILVLFSCLGLMAADIQGTITATDQDQPLEGVVVTIFSVMSDNFQSEVTTTETGHYEFNDLEYGMYLITVHTEGYHPFMQETNLNEQNESVTLDIQLEVAGNGGGTPEGEGVISGTVVDADGNPVAEAMVNLMGEGGQGGHGGNGGMNHFEAFTAEDGTFLFENLPYGTYALMAMSEMGMPTHVEGLEVTEDAPVLANVEVVLGTVEEPEGDGTISGTVVDAEGNPVAEAMVNLMGEGCQGGNGGMNHFEAITAEDGTFLFENLPYGIYNLVAMLEMGMPAHLEGLEITEDAPVLAGVEVVLETFEIPDGDGTISGTVVDAEGNPVAEAMVNLMGECGQGGNGGMNHFEAITAEDGTFSFENLPYGIYNLVAMSEMGMPTHLEGLEITEDAPVLAGVEVVLGTVEEPEGDGTISGTVVDAEGNPVAEAMVNLMGECGQGGNGGMNHFEAITAEDGTFLFENLPYGIYTLMAMSEMGMPTHVEGLEVTEDAPVLANIEVVLGTVEEPEGEGVISGTVVDADGNPVAEAMVNLMGECGQGGNGGGNHFEAITAEDGTFLFENLPYGTYTLMAMNEMGMPTHLEGLEISEDAPVLADLELILDEQGGNLGNGTLVVNVNTTDTEFETFITIFHEESGVVYEEIAVEGIAAFENIQDGNYVLSAHLPGFGMYIYEAAESFEDATIIEVVENETTTITIDLTDYELETFAVSGTISDTEGNPIQNAFVSLMPIDAQGGNNPGHGGQGGNGWGNECMVITDENGNYTLDTPGGEYILAAFAEEFAPIFWPGALTPENAQALVVEEDLSEINLTLLPEGTEGYTISGNVTIDGEIPTSPVYVIAVSSDEDDEVINAVMTDENGDFTIYLTHVGSYYIFASSGGTVSMYYPNTFDWNEAIAVVVDGTIEDIDFNLIFSEMQGTESLIGFVTDDQNNPVSGATVLVSDSEGAPIAFTSSNSNGQYSMAFLADADYNFKATKFQYESYTAVVNPAQQDSENAVITPAGTTEEEDNNVESVTASLNNYPNPFNPVTNISYSLASDESVELAVYNVRGQLIRTLVSSVQEKGNHSIEWNGVNNNNQPVSSGIYFYRLQTANENVSRKMVLMK